MRPNVTTLFGALLLAGCGGADTGAGGGGTASASDWDATDACALLDKAVLGAALNDAVTETSLAMVNQAGEVSAATSECTYLLKGGGRASLMTRRSPIADNTEAAMNMARKATQETLNAMGGRVLEDVPGLGKSAFFVPGINQLNAFIDEDKFVILTLSSAPNATAKDTAVALVRKIGS